MNKEAIETIGYFLAGILVMLWVSRSWRILLRDYFAIRAFQTRLAKYNDWTLDSLIEQAYIDADAMLKERSK